LHPGLDDAHEQFMDTFDEMETQLGKEMDRVTELKQKLDQDPGEILIVDRLSLRSLTLLERRCLLHDRI
jgi:hypothetical protein